MSIFDSKPKENTKKPEEIQREAAFWTEFNKQSADIAAIERELTEITKKLARVERKVYRAAADQPELDQANNPNWWANKKL